MSILRHAGNSGIKLQSCGENFPIRSFRIGRPNLPDVRVATFAGVELRTTAYHAHVRHTDILVRAKYIADAAWECRADGDGCTFYAYKTGSPVSGYCVSIAGQETKLVIDDYDENDLYADCKVRDYDPIVADVVGKLVRNIFRQPTACIGCWVHDGYRYLDVTRVIHDLDNALNFARDNGQLAIYDLSSGTEITV